MFTLLASFGCQPELKQRGSESAQASEDADRTDAEKISVARTDSASQHRQNVTPSLPDTSATEKKQRDEKAYRTRIVDFGADLGNALYREQIGSRTPTDIEMDIDGDGETEDDRVAMWPLKFDEPLIGSDQPDYDSEVTNAIFYGGLVGYFANTPKGRLTEGFLNQNHELRDDFNFMGGQMGGVVEEGQAYRAYALFFWKEEDFLNCRNAHRVTFDGESVFGMHISRYWDGLKESRGVVRDGDQFYISEATQSGVYKSHLFHPTKTRWAKYDPTPPHQIGFDADNAEFTEHEFEDVTAIGFYLAQPELIRSTQQLKWHSFEAYAVVHRPETPGFHAEMVAVPAGEDSWGGTVPGFYAGRTEVSYALWKKVYKWAVSNQYLFDLGRPGYIFDTDGDMGSMALTDGEYTADHPATGMTWTDAIAWCNALSELEGKTPAYYHDAEHDQVFRKAVERSVPADYGWRPTIHVKWDADGYRLPTPAEWEHAALADAEELPRDAEFAWTSDNADGRTKPVGELAANANGLHDVAGNVWEFVWDGSKSACNTEKQGTHTVLGGDFRSPEDPSSTGLSSVAEKPWRGHYGVGFRIVRREAGQEAPPVAPEPPTSEGSAQMDAPVPAWTIVRGQPVPAAEDVSAVVEPKMVAIPEGEYIRSHDEAEVTLSPFFLGKTEVTFEHFRRVEQWAAANGYELDGDGDSGSMDWKTGAFAHGSDEPVAGITWHTAMAWCNALSEMTGRTPVYYTDEQETRVLRRPNLWRIAMYRGTQGYVTGEDERRWMPIHVKWEADGFRLPTEAEWSYALLGKDGTSSESLSWLSGPGDVEAFAWIKSNSGGRTHAVGQKKANPFGLHDLIGNVREWVWDWPHYDYYRSQDPKGGDKYELFGKRLMGADFRTPSNKVSKGVTRWQEDPSATRPWFGFRVARSEAGTHPEEDQKFTPKTVLEINVEDYDPLQGRVHRANLRRDGHFRTSGVPDLSGVKWSVKLGGKLASSPVVVGGVLYVGGQDKHVYALDAETGDLKWKTKTDGPVNSSAAVVDGVVYIGSEAGTLYALDADTGEVAWSYRRAHHRPSNAAPAVAYGVVFAQFGKWDTGGLSGIGIDSHEEVWRLRVGTGNDNASPLLYKDRLYHATHSIHGYMASLRTEVPLWHSNKGVARFTPAMTEDTVIAGHRWIRALDAMTGELGWQFKTQAPLNKGFFVKSSPAIAGERVYFGSPYGRVYALRLADHRKMWQFEAENRFDGDVSVAKGVVYIGGDDHHLYALDAGTGDLKWKQKLGGAIKTSPWVGNGVVYVSCADGRVYALH